MQESKVLLSLYEEEVELPVLRILNRKLMENSQYRKGARAGYLNLVSDPECIECTDYEKGVMAGIALYDVCLNIKHHDREVFNKAFAESGSETMDRIRRFVDEFCEVLPPEPEDVVLVPLAAAYRVHSSFSASMPFITVGEAKGLA